MRKPYSHEYGRFVHKFKNTACYTNLTSRILSAARGGNYYGPSEGQYTGRWQYEPRTKCKCHNKQLCDAIREDLYVASTKSSCLIPDQATDWYGQQKQLRSLKKAIKCMSPKELMEYQCRYHGNFQFQSPPSPCLDLKTPIRSVPCVPYMIGSAKRISPEFLELLKQHDLRQRQTSVLNCLPPNYTNRRLLPQSKPEVVYTCNDGRPCYCGTNALPPELIKSDTQLDGHRCREKGFLNKWCFSSQEQTYADEDNDYYRRDGSVRSLKHHARSQPRLTTHVRCPSEACTQDTCSFRCKEPKMEPRKPPVHPRLHGFSSDYNSDNENERLNSEPDLRPRVHQQESIQEIWTKPNATQMRESKASLRPRYFAPKYIEPQIIDKCAEKPKVPPVPPKPKGYVLGQRVAPDMTKPPKLLKRKHSCLRSEKSITDLTPRHRVQECPIAKETLIEDKTCYPHLGPRYIPQGPNTKKFDSICSKRKRSPREERTPKWVFAPKTHPEYHKDKPTRSKRQTAPTRSFSETRPRYRDLSSDSSPQRYKRGILKSNSIEKSSYRPSVTGLSGRNIRKAPSGPISCFTQERYRRKNKPNADDTTDDTDGENRSALCTSASAQRPRLHYSDMRCTRPDKSRAPEPSYVRVGKCNIPARPPAARKYKATVCILKGHETCYKESSHWAGIPSNYPRPYLEKANRNKKELEITKKQRLRMWATKECPKPKYAPASKCQGSLKPRCPSNEPHKALYTPRKRLTTRDASPYHRECYKSSSAGES